MSMVRVMAAILKSPFFSDKFKASLLSASMSRVVVVAFVRVTMGPVETHTTLMDP